MRSPSVDTMSLPKIEELPPPDRDHFDANIRAAGKPVVIPGLVKDWPAVRAASTSFHEIVTYLQSMDAGAALPTMIAPPEAKGRYFYSQDMSRFNFERREIPLRATLSKLYEMLDSEAPMGVYVGASATDQSMPDFAKSNGMPLLDASVVPKIWLGNAAQIAAHFDISENIACVVSGKRRFIVFPPDQIENLYVGPVDYNMAGQPASLVDLKNIDYGKFPRAEAALAHAQVADLEPGDAIYIPSLWWHGVHANGPLNVLVNYWWDDLRHGSPMNVLALALLVIRDLPANEREGWRTFFDHYIFGENASHAADHVPPPFRGALGEKSPQRDAQIKAFLRAQLSSVIT